LYKYSARAATCWKCCSAALCCTSLLSSLAKPWPLYGLHGTEGGTRSSSMTAGAHYPGQTSCTQSQHTIGYIRGLQTLRAVYHFP
jgi:hypothetical protein